MLLPPILRRFEEERRWVCEGGTVSFTPNNSRVTIRLPIDWWWYHHKVPPYHKGLGNAV
jgi:hypothetical protein